MSTLPDLTEHEAIVYAYLLHHKANAHEIERSFKGGVASGAWRGVATLQHENHVSKYLKSLEEKGLIKAVPQSEMKEELLRQNPPAKRRWGRPKKDAPKRGVATKNLGRYYATDPKFFVSLLAPSAQITEEEARAFLQAIEKFSRPPAEVVKTLDAISNPNNITALGYLRLLTEELGRYYEFEQRVNLQKELAAGDRKSADHTRLLLKEAARQCGVANQKYLQRRREHMRRGPLPPEWDGLLRPNPPDSVIITVYGGDVSTNHKEIHKHVEDVARLRGEQRLFASGWRYLHPPPGVRVIGREGENPDHTTSIIRFCQTFYNFHDTELMWMLQEQKGLSRPAPFPA